jgi:hypothetical protein
MAPKMLIFRLGKWPQNISLFRDNKKKQNNGEKNSKRMIKRQTK